MMLRCPNCGAGMSLDALVSHQELRQLLAAHCASSLGRERMLALEASADY